MKQLFLCVFCGMLLSTTTMIAQESTSQQNKTLKIKTRSLSDYSREYTEVLSKSSPVEYVGDKIDGLNNSKYDKDITYTSQLSDLNNTRAQLQSEEVNIVVPLVIILIICGIVFITIDVALKKY